MEPSERYQIASTARRATWAGGKIAEVMGFPIVKLPKTAAMLPGATGMAKVAALTTPFGFTDTALLAMLSVKNVPLLFAPPNCVVPYKLPSVPSVSGATGFLPWVPVTVVKIPERVILKSVVLVAP